MAFGDFLFQGSPPPQVNQYATSDTQPPLWWQAYTKGLIEKASSIAAEPYQAYTGPRVQGFTQDQLDAYSNIRQNQGATQPYVDSAKNSIATASQPFNQSIFQQYQSPYIEGVVDRIADLGARNLHENIIPGISDTFIRAGQYGGSRNVDFMNRAVRDTNESVLGRQAEALQSSFDSAMTNYGQGMNRTLEAGNAMGNLGSNVQQFGLRDAAALEGVGQTAQGLGQRSLDTAYQDFINQRDYPKQQISFMNEAIRGLQPGQSTSTTTTGPANAYSPSPLAQLAGMGLAFGSLGQKKGGFIKKMRMAPRKGGALERMRAANG